ncbi:MAG TPA: HAD-IA family hydrolase, partial [Gemmatimonadaceae bacterium]|nr:HAD-IA family hydrolase [Gemmatimonadaceae bacterium]
TRGNLKATIALACQAILFDFDGVLVNSAACVERLLTAWAIRHSLAPADVIHVAHGRRTVETVRLVAPHLDAEAEASALTAAEAVTTDGIAEVPGAKTLVESLARDRWAIVTSGARAVAKLRLEATGLPEPRVLICAEDVTRGKPDPEGYLAAAGRLGVAPYDCIIVEDAPAGLAAANAARIRSVGVVGTYRVGALTDATYVVAALSSLRVVEGRRSDPLTVQLTPA